jgi:hypothetical protein
MGTLMAFLSMLCPCLAGPGSWNIAAHVLLKYIGSAKAGDARLTVVAVMLGNAGMEVRRMLAQKIH